MALLLYTSSMSRGGCIPRSLTSPTFSSTAGEFRLEVGGREEDEGGQKALLRRFFLSARLLTRTESSSVCMCHQDGFPWWSVYELLPRERQRDRGVGGQRETCGCLSPQLACWQRVDAEIGRRAQHLFLASRADQYALEAPSLREGQEEEEEEGKAIAGWAMCGGLFSYFFFGRTGRTTRD